MKKWIFTALLCSMPTVALAGKVAFSHPSKEVVVRSCHKGGCTHTKMLTQFSKSKSKVIVKAHELTANTKSSKQKPSNWTVVTKHKIKCSYTAPYVESDGNRLDLRKKLTHATYVQGELYLAFCHAKDRKKFHDNADAVMGKLGYKGHGS